MNFSRTGSVQMSQGVFVLVKPCALAICTTKLMSACVCNISGSVHVPKAMPQLFTSSTQVPEQVHLAAVYCRFTKRWVRRAQHNSAAIGGSLPSCLAHWESSSCHGGRGHIPHAWLHSQFVWGGLQLLSGDSLCNDCSMCFASNLIVHFCDVGWMLSVL